jgi:hypothetical protein
VWINVVGYRDQLQDLPGPPKVNTTHKAALQRWKEVQAMLAEAAARQAAAAAAQAAAHAAAAAAASAAAALSGPPLGGAVQLPVVKADDLNAPAAGAVPDGTAQSSSGDQAAITSKTTSSSSSSQQEYNSSSLEQVELALMSFVRRSPGSGLTLQLNGKPWLMTGFDVPHALQLAVQENKRYQLLELMDQARGLGFNTMRVWAFGDGGAPGVGSAVYPAWQQDEDAGEQRQQQQGDEGQQEMRRLVMQPAPGMLNATVMR